MQAFGRLRPDSNLKSWFFTILRNVWLNHQRRISQRMMVDIDEKSAQISDIQRHSGDNPLAVYLTKVKHADVRSAVHDLPVVYREVVLLREFEELSYQEIADVLQCPIGTVMSRLQRAREKLKIALQDWGNSKKQRCGRGMPAMTDFKNLGAL